MFFDDFDTQIQSDELFASEYYDYMRYCYEQENFEEVSRRVGRIPQIQEERFSETI